jgi:superfamily I DNA/RNA helicase/mRNA-degrading endonuclease RelE of RelBE toxin-antitoxin system
MSYEIDLKPTFLNQLRTVPKAEHANIMQKILLVQEAPQPDGKNKKRLKGYQNPVYRIRSGDYRIVYAFNEQAGWVALLGVDLRRDVYEDDEWVGEEIDSGIGDVPAVEDLLAREDPSVRSITPKPKQTSAGNQLPAKIDEVFLRRLGVADEYWPALTGCKTVDDLTAADVPEPVITQIFDVITSSDYDYVMQQPTFIADGVDDLLRFAEGELVDFLLKLDPAQERLANWAVDGAGPTLVKGGPGTGKSTVALYRARSLVAALRASGVQEPRILFTTYTNALVSSSRQLLRRLLGDDADCITVRTADNLVMEIVTSANGRPHVIDAPGLRAAMKEAFDTAVFDGNALQRLAQKQTIERLTHDYLLEEIGDVIEARELTTLDEYLNAPRAGRRVPLNATQRTAVWRVHEALDRALAKRGMLTWERLRRRAAEIVRERRWPERFDGVIVDEAQDLDPTILRLLVDLCRTPDRVFITADANQSIYGSSFRWSDVHQDLRFTGRTGILRRNYRSTREIGEAARSYLSEAVLDDEEQSPEQTEYILTGPPPAVRAVERAYDETKLLERFLRGAAREFRLGIGASAILVPSEQAGKAIAARLCDVGLDAEFMSGRELDLERRVIKVITLKSAKGLEFPIVALAGFLEGHIPGPARGAQSEEAAEGHLRERRTMFVAMTRAMRGLLVATPAGKTSPLFSGFDERFWNSGGDGED